MKKRDIKDFVEQVHVICSTDQRLEKDIMKLKKIFEKLSQENAINTILDEQNETECTTEKKHMLLLPFQGQKEDFIIKSMKKRFRNLLLRCIVPTVIFDGSKLILKFQVKDRTIFQHNHDVIYHGNCPKNGCPDNYAGKTARRILGCWTTLKQISIAIFINTLLGKVIKL